MHKRNGLALLVALMMAAALVALTFSLASLVLLERRHVTVSDEGRKMRGAAELAAFRGLAELQVRMGPDQACDHVDLRGLPVSFGKAGRGELSGGFSEEGLTCAWSIKDLSLGHDVAAKYVAGLQASAWARTSAGRPKLAHALPDKVTSAQRVALEAGGREFFGVPMAPGTTWQVRGLLTDAAHGGWRRDMADDAVLTEELGGSVAELLTRPAFRDAPSKGYPLAQAESAGVTLRTMPQLVDFRLSMGFFNARSDGRHRLRFHGTAVFWNPLSVPVLAGPQGRLFLVELVGSPEVTITNLDTSSSFTTDLDDCPQEDFGIIRQGLRERGLWCWTEITDSVTYGMNGRGLLPGEVYALVNPSPQSQPQGLARILTRMTWKMDRGHHGAGWRRPDPTVFLPTDRIEIAVRFRGKVGLRLRPYAGEPDRDAAIADYPAKPLFILENIPFPDFLLRTTGEDYSREDSAGYEIGERRACLRVRFRPGDGWSAWGSPGVRRAWDFSVPEQATEWVVDHPVLAALDVVDHDASPLAGPLWDLRPNRHDGGEVGAFASIRLRDFPGAPIVSVGAFRHLEPTGSRSWTERLDRTFASAPLTAPELGVVSHNPFLIAVGAIPSTQGVEAARCLQVIGPFNVNSREPRAWESLLRDAAGAWSSGRGGPFEPNEIKGSLFFTRPTGAGLAKWGSLGPTDLSDAAIADLAKMPFDSLVAQQSVRRLEDGLLAKLADRIVDLQPSHGWPFPSVRAFAESGLLAAALKSAEIDATFANLASSLPVRLNEADLLEAWAPILTVRGDTFAIEGRASGPQGAVLCELVVQRVAEGHVSAVLGRRFRIISVRFRNQ